MQKGREAREVWELVNNCVLEIDSYCFAERLMKAGERQMHIKHILQKYFDPLAHQPMGEAAPDSAFMSPEEFAEIMRSLKAYCESPAGEALQKYRKAIDDIYNSGGVGRDLVRTYFGLWHL